MIQVLMRWLQERRVGDKLSRALQEVCHHLIYTNDDDDDDNHKDHDDDDDYDDDHDHHELPRTLTKVHHLSFTVS